MPILEDFLFEINKNDIAGNPASVILATSIPKIVAKENYIGNPVVPPVVSVKDIPKTETKISNKSVDDAKPPLETKNISLNNENKKISAEKQDGPRLLFVGNFYPGFGGGGDALQIQTTASEPIEENSVPEITDLSAPVLSVPQCDYSLSP